MPWTKKWRVPSPNYRLTVAGSHQLMVRVSKRSEDRDFGSNRVRFLHSHQTVDTVGHTKLGRQRTCNHRKRVRHSFMVVRW